MSEFQAYLYLGFTHITDLRGYDHILFVIALCASYQLREWKKILILITAFTLGHSLTLALATFRVLQIDSSLVELLIPLTILITALGNLFLTSKITHTEDPDRRFYLFSSANLRYLLAVFFGLIHGLGFSNFLRQMLLKSQSIALPLLAFNLGLEFGQILILIVFLIINAIFVITIVSNNREWSIFISGAVAGIALMLIANNDLFQNFFRSNP